MTDGPGKFNLLYEPWIPVLWGNGATERVGIWRALTEAGGIRQIAACNPMDDVSLFRFLLAVLQWCKPEMSGEEREGLQGAEGIPVEWLRKLEAAGEEGRFNLLGEGERFYQDRDVSTHKPGRTVSDLFAYLPAATEVRHFRHLSDKTAALCRACCAVGLVRLPACATQGGQGKSPSLNNAPPAYFFPAAASLLATFALTWPLSGSDRDGPAWEPSRCSEEVGILEGLTWQPRSVWIGPTAERQDASCTVCARCGAGPPLLRDLVFEKGRGRKGDPRPWRDPHVAWAAAESVALDPEAEETDKALRGSDPLKYPALDATLWMRTVRAVLESCDDAGPVPWVSAAVPRLRLSEGLRVVCALPSTKIAKTFDEHRGAWALPRFLLEGSSLRRGVLQEVSVFEALAPARYLRAASPRRKSSGAATAAWACAFGDTYCRLYAALPALLGLPAGDPRPGRPPGDTASWRGEARSALAEAVLRATRSLVSGSFLRRREAERRALALLDEALRKQAGKAAAAAGAPEPSASETNTGGDDSGDED